MNSNETATYFRPSPTLHESPYLTTYSFEKIDIEYIRGFWADYWSSSIYACVLYVVLIFGIQAYMKSRKPFELNNALIKWNWGLAIFSIVVFTRTVPELWTALTAENGHHNSLCHWSHKHCYQTSFWTAMFLLSKFVELGDTIFIVLRKKKLLFLHWYHHMMTLLCAALMGLDYEPYMVWYSVMNSFIHSFMYTYFALMAMGIKLPRGWARVLTAMQLIQMGFGFWVNLYPASLMILKGENADCPRNPFVLKLAFAIAVSYLFLFGEFYYSSYVKPKSTVGASASSKTLPTATSSGASNTRKKVD